MEIHWSTHDVTESVKSGERPSWVAAGPVGRKRHFVLTEGPSGELQLTETAKSSQLTRIRMLARRLNSEIKPETASAEVVAAAVEAVLSAVGQLPSGVEVVRVYVLIGYNKEEEDGRTAYLGLTLEVED